MQSAPYRIVQSFADLHLLVIGEAMLDTYLEGSSERLCQEAPVPVVAVQGRHDLPGGAANTAVNVRSLGAKVSFLSVAGDDAEAEILLHALQCLGVSTNFLRKQAGRRTLAKQRVMAASHLLVRVDQGDTAPLDSRSEEHLLSSLERLFPQCDGLIISDYCYGILTRRVIETLAVLQQRTPRVIVADSKRLRDFCHIGLTAVKPNYKEAAELLGLNLDESTRSRAEQIAAHGPRILRIAGARQAAVTLDVDGAMVFENGHPPYRTYTRPGPHSRAAGAGDTYVAAYTLALAAHADLPTAAELAALASEAVVGRTETAACTAGDLLNSLTAADKIALDAAQLVARLESLRSAGQRLVFTNGCFDILHRGHVGYLNRAKSLGDVLIVGVNSDQAIRRLKGPQRPINSLEDRLQVLAALSCIDHLVVFDEDTPHRLIRAIRPHVFAKGGDYTRQNLPEAELIEQLGGVVRILPLFEQRSTTTIIERIQSASPTDNGKGRENRRLPPRKSKPAVLS